MVANHANRHAISPAFSMLSPIVPQQDERNLAARLPLYQLVCAYIFVVQQLYYLRSYLPMIFVLYLHVNLILLTMKLFNLNRLGSIGIYWDWGGFSVAQSQPNPNSYWELGSQSQRQA